VQEIVEIQKSALPYKYEHDLHCNEVMLLPYYIASMNIEHEYCEQTGGYKSFEGICLVDTFEDQSIEQLSLFVPENMKRVETQRKSDIFVVIGNPPYNVGQLNENDNNNNKNRKYSNKNKTGIDDRVAATYAKASKATLKNSLSDVYVKAIRWASDRIGNEGIVAFVTNNSFIDGIAFNGMRQYLEQEFDQIYVFDLGGNIRKNPKLSGTTHNVFGIQVGVSVNILVKKSPSSSP
jgi:predicted helicase